jgi:hypothetical protein
VQAVPGLRFTGLAAGLILIAAVYCLVHGLVIDDDIDLLRTLTWAFVSTFPCVCAWEGLKWLSARPAQRLQLARRLLLPPALVRSDARSPCERLRDMQRERVLDVPTRRGTSAVRACDIEYVKAAGNYVELITGDRTTLLRVTLHDLGDQLQAVGFVRVHRSLLVNSLHVLAVRRGPRGRQLVKLSSGAELPVGRQFDGNVCTLVTIAHRSSPPT